jgi:hypothetical protein
MEVAGVVFIATNHFLVIAFFLSTTDGPPLHINGQNRNGQQLRLYQRLQVH